MADGRTDDLLWHNRAQSIASRNKKVTIAPVLHRNDINER